VIEEFSWAIAQRDTLPNLTRARMMDAHVQAQRSVFLTWCHVFPVPFPLSRISTRASQHRRTWALCQWPLEIPRFRPRQIPTFLFRFRENKESVLSQRCLYYGLLAVARDFGDEEMTAAMINRLVHRGHIFINTGDRYRFRESLRRLTIDTA